jgi:uncharacterized membrane protein
MPFLQLLFSYLLTTLVFFAIDMLWLGFIAKGMYNRHLGHLLSEQVNWAAAIIFYLLFIVGIFIFAILPAVEKESWRHALLYGALFGFFTYATYDFTNLATLKNWPVQILIPDLIWGMVLTASVATAGYFITQWIRN